ncbi:MAG: hypothetical protein HWN81_12000 [Candidatus Lokiarchaeota archaeon]|nr:hypothetical protein [Candidatus Lokiarchaeota archaeon]
MNKEEQKQLEDSFRKMLNAKPNGVCINHMEDHLTHLEESGVDVSNMRKWYEDKKAKEGVQYYILPLKK